MEVEVGLSPVAGDEVEGPAPQALVEMGLEVFGTE